MLTFYALIMALFIGGAGSPTTHPVAYVSAAPYNGALGLACTPAFHGRAGNVQDRCPEGFTGIVLYDGAFRDEQMLRHVVAHEAYHLDHPELGPPGDPFREAEAYRQACTAYPIPDCGGWIGRLDAGLLP